MKTNDIIRGLALRLNISQAQARLLLRQKLLQLRQMLRDRQEVSLPGLGKLQVRTSKARRNYIPGKNAICHIPQRRRVTFKAEAALARALRELKTP